MKALIIDSTMNELLIMLATDEKYTYKTSKNCRFHNTLIMTMIDELLVENCLTVQDLTHICCVTGPGSFTGIRIGVSVCNGLSFGAGLKKVELSSLFLITNAKEGRYITAIKARESNYYYALFEDGNIVDVGDDELENLYKSCEKIFIRDEENPIIAKIYYLEFLNKVKKGEYIDYFTPNYMKLSQAERLKK